MSVEGPSDSMVIESPALGTESQESAFTPPEVIDTKIAPAVAAIEQLR
jgi:hypothetical protein